MPFEFPHTQSKNIAVIGAGISGMGAAHLLAKSHSVTLLILVYLVFLKLILFKMV